MEDLIQFTEAEVLVLEQLNFFSVDQYEFNYNNVTVSNNYKTDILIQKDTTDTPYIMTITESILDQPHTKTKEVGYSLENQSLADFLNMSCIDFKNKCKCYSACIQEYGVLPHDIHEQEEREIIDGIVAEEQIEIEQDRQFVDDMEEEEASGDCTENKAGDPCDGNKKTGSGQNTDALYLTQNKKLNDAIAKKYNNNNTQ